MVGLMMPFKQKLKKPNSTKVPRLKNGRKMGERKRNEAIKRETKEQANTN